MSACEEWSGFVPDLILSVSKDAGAQAFVLRQAQHEEL